MFDVISTISKWLASVLIELNFVPDDCSTYNNGREFFLLLLASYFSYTSVCFALLLPLLKTSNWIVTHIFCNCRIVSKWKPSIRNNNAGWYGKGKHSITSLSKPWSHKLVLKKSFLSNEGTCEEFSWPRA